MGRFWRGAYRPNFRVSWRILTLFVPIETRMNALHIGLIVFLNLFAASQISHVASHVGIRSLRPNANSPQPTRPMHIDTNSPQWHRQLAPPTRPTQCGASWRWPHKNQFTCRRSPIVYALALIPTLRPVVINSNYREMSLNLAVI